MKVINYVIRIYRAQDKTLATPFLLFRMLSATSNKENLTHTQNLSVKGIYWFMDQKIQWWGALQGGVIRVLAPFFWDICCSITFVSQLCSESCFPHGGKVRPVIPGILSKLHIHGGKREFNLHFWIPGRIPKLWAGWSLFGVSIVTKGEAFTNWLRSVRACPWRWDRARHSKNTAAILGGGVEWRFAGKAQNSYKVQRASKTGKWWERWEASPREYLSLGRREFWRGKTNIVSVQLDLISWEQCV